MGLFSNWKPKTIAGKILKGVVTVGVPAAATVVTGGIAGGLITGAGALAGVVKATSKVAGVIKGGVNVVGKVATAATNLATGTTKEQREMIQEQKQEQKADIQKLNTIEKLMNAGATVREAAAKVGVNLSELGGLFGLPSESDEIQAYASEVKAAPGVIPMSADNKKLLTYAGIGLAALLLLPKIIKGR